MKLTAGGIAVLAEDTDYSRRVERGGTLACDGATLAAILPLLRTGMVVVDGGAFIGDHTASYLDAVGPAGAVWAFEPNPEALACLRHNCPRARVIPAALSDGSGRCRLERLANAAQTRVFPAGAGSCVPCVPLDSFAIAADVIKLDVQGWEVRALQGAVRTIRTHRPVLVVECHAAELARAGESPDTLRDLIDRLGYDMRPLLDWQRDGDPKLDLLCTPR